MVTFHDWLVTAHVFAGAIALAVFWVPVLARKGSALHVRAGRLYTNLMYTVCVTAFVASIMVIADPIGIRRPGESLTGEEAHALGGLYRMYSLFLLMLSILVFTSTKHGLAALRARRDPAALKARGHRTMLVSLAGLAVAVGSIGVVNGELLLIIFAGISLSASVGMLRESRLETPSRRQLVIAHFNGLIGSGVGAYTAFFAFGGARLLADVLTGQWQVVPWILPAIVGTIVVAVLKRRYSRPVGSSTEASGA